MKRGLVLLAALACGAAAFFLPAAAATPPQDVTITIDETCHAPPAVPSVTGAITATGGVFGTQTLGTLASVSFRPVGWPGQGVQYPVQDHVFVYTATDEYTFGAGTFRIAFEGSCNLTIDFDTGGTVADCTGTWQVNGGAGDYARLRGTGTFV